MGCAASFRDVRACRRRGPPGRRRCRRRVDVAAPGLGCLAGSRDAVRRGEHLLLLAAICERRGDQDGRRLELDAARRLFKQLNAEPRLARITEQADAPRISLGSLSERELQVLRLLAAGKTNRAIAEELFISEKTVARHVSNIFDKVGVSSRTGATAWAFHHNLT